MKILAYIPVLIILLFTSCEKSTWFVGKKEFVTVTYDHDENAGYSISEADKSNFVNYDSLYIVDSLNGSSYTILSGLSIKKKEKNYIITDIITENKKDGKFVEESEYSNGAITTKSPISVVLALDFSYSLRNEIYDIKNYASDFIDEVVSTHESSQIAIVFFSDRSNIIITGFYNALNASNLKNIVDNMTGGEGETALYMAAGIGDSLLASLNFSGVKAFVLFTDGNDTASHGWQKTDSQNQLDNTSNEKYGIYLKGSDETKSDLTSLIGDESNIITAKNEKSLQKVFVDMSKKLTSTYDIIYRRNDQTINEPIDIKFTFKVEKI